MWKTESERLIEGSLRACVILTAKDGCQLTPGLQSANILTYVNDHREGRHNCFKVNPPQKSVSWVEIFRCVAFEENEVITWQVMWMTDTQLGFCGNQISVYLSTSHHIYGETGQNRQTALPLFSYAHSLSIWQTFNANRHTCFSLGLGYKNISPLSTN